MSAVLARRYFVRGRDEMGRGEYDAAVESFRAAVDLVPAFISGRIGYAAALVRIGDMPRAAQALRAGLPRATGNRSRYDLLLHLGDVLVAAGDFFGAEDAYRQAGELLPGSGAPAAGLARVQAKLGRYGDAFTSLLAASRAEP